MRKAIIDLGTNTFHLLIAEVEGSSIQTVLREQVAVKLGEGGINQGFISDKAYERGMKALALFSRLLAKEKVDSCRAFATSAVRSASNGHQFIQEAKSEHGIQIEIISGEVEAAFIYKGVQATLPTKFPPHLVMDIGGGSVEFILADENGAKWMQSFDIGCARLVEQFHKHDPIREAEITDLYDFLDEALRPLWNVLKESPTPVLVGSAGSFESVLDLVRELYGEEPEEIHSGLFQINQDLFFELNEELSISSRAEREQMRGLADYRVEMMVVASLLIAYVIETYGINQLYCSMNSLKEGALLS